MASQPLFTLNNGVQLPAVGLGCWMGPGGGGKTTEEMVTMALKLGYRHFDTASGYSNEEQVGKAIRESGVPRSEIFLVTKLGNGDHTRVREAFEDSLKRLDCEYIDLYLVHWPNAQKADGSWYRPDESPTYVETWKEMEKLLDTGKVRTIGVSNFSVKTFEVLLPQVKIVPAVNQVEMHPLYPQVDLLEYSNPKGIHTTAYSPLGQSNWAWWDDETLKKIAAKKNVTPAQVLLSWGVQRGVSVIPKSQNEGRLKQNLELIVLDGDDVDAVNSLHRAPGMHKNLLMEARPPTGTVCGWTFEEMGWNIDKTGKVIE